MQNSSNKLQIKPKTKNNYGYNNNTSKIRTQYCEEASVEKGKEYKHHNFEEKQAKYAQNSFRIQSKQKMIYINQQNEQNLPNVHENQKYSFKKAKTKSKSSSLPSLLSKEKSINNIQDHFQSKNPYLKAIQSYNSQKLLKINQNQVFSKEDYLIIKAKFNKEQLGRKQHKISRSLSLKKLYANPKSKSLNKQSEPQQVEQHIKIKEGLQEIEEPLNNKEQQGKSNKNSLYSFKMKMLFCNRPVLKIQQNYSNGTNSSIAPQDRQKLQKIGTTNKLEGGKHTTPVISSTSIHPSHTNSNSTGSQKFNNGLPNNLHAGTAGHNRRRAGVDHGLQNISFEPIKMKMKNAEQERIKQIQNENISKIQSYFHTFFQQNSYEKYKAKYFPNINLFLQLIRSGKNYNPNEQQYAPNFKPFKLQNTNILKLQETQTNFENASADGHSKNTIQIPQILQKHHINHANAGRMQRFSLPTSFNDFSHYNVVVNSHKKRQEFQSQDSVTQNQQSKSENKNNQKLWYISTGIYRILWHKIQHSTLYRVLLENIANRNIFIIKVDLQEGIEQLLEKVKTQQKLRYKWLNIHHIQNTTKLNISAKNKQEQLYVISHVVNNMLHLLPIVQKIKHNNPNFESLNTNDNDYRQLVLEYTNENHITKYRRWIIKEATRIYMKKYHKMSLQSQIKLNQQISLTKNIQSPENNCITIQNTEQIKHMRIRDKLFSRAHLNPTNKKYNKTRQLLNIITKIFPQNNIKIKPEFMYQDNEDSDENETDTKQYSIKQLYQVYYKNILTRVTNIEENLEQNMSNLRQNQKMDEELQEEIYQKQFLKIFSISSSAQFQNEYCHVKNYLNKSQTTLNKFQQLKLRSSRMKKGSINYSNFNNKIKYSSFKHISNLAKAVNDQSINQNEKGQSQYERKRLGYKIYNNVMKVRNIYNGILKNNYSLDNNFQLINKGYDGYVMNKENMIYIKVYLLQIRYKNKTNPNKQIPQRKYICIKSQNMEKINKNIYIIVGVQEYKNMIKTKIKDKRKNRIYDYWKIEKQEGYIYKYLLDNVSKWNQIATFKQFKQILIDLPLISSQSYFLQPHNPHNDTRSSINLSLSCRDSIIINQSLLRPSIHPINIMQYCIITKLTTETVGSSMCIMNKQPIFIKVRLLLYPSCNTVIIIAEINNTLIKLTSNNNYTNQQKKNNMSKFVETNSLQISNKYYSICTYYNQFAECISQSYQQLINNSIFSNQCITTNNIQNMEASGQFCYNYNHIDKQIIKNFGEKFQYRHEKVLNNIYKIYNSKNMADNTDNGLAENGINIKGNRYNWLLKLKQTIKNKLRKLIKIQICTTNNDDSNKIKSQLYIKLYKTEIKTKKQTQSSISHQKQEVNCQQVIDNNKIDQQLSKNIIDSKQIQNSSISQLQVKDKTNNIFSVKQQENDLKLQLIECKYLWYHYQLNKQLCFVIYKPYYNTTSKQTHNSIQICKYFVLSINKFPFKQLIYIKPLQSYLTNEVNNTNDSEQLQKDMGEFNRLLLNIRKYRYKMMNIPGVSKIKCIIKYRHQYLYSQKQKSKDKRNRGYVNINQFEIQLLNSRKLMNNISYDNRMDSSKNLGPLFTLINKQILISHPKKDVNLQPVQQYISKFKIDFNNYSQDQPHYRRSYITERVKRRFMKVIKYNPSILEL